jgi:hypothetical protein
MTDIYYPHDSLPMPLQDGYGFQPVSPLKRTQLTTGRAAASGVYINPDSGQRVMVHGD